MATGRLPDDGQLQLGPVVLPAGRRVHAEQGSGQPVVWVTRHPVPDAGRVWSALSHAHPETGLVPLLLGDDPAEDAQGLIFDRLSDIPSDISELDDLDPAQVLRGLWDDRLPDNDVQWDGPRLVQARAPFSREFPGLAPGQDAKLSPDRLDAALASQPPARVGLVPAGRPADVLPLVGWLGPEWPPMALPLAAVLRSWEARFGAKLLKIGFGAEMRVLAERPPRESRSAQLLAAEHFVLCDECAGQGLRDISTITTALINAPVWTFWWD